MIAVNAQFDPAQLAAFNLRMQAMQDYTGRSMKKVVFATSRDFTFAAINCTPVAQKYVDRHGTDRNGREGVWALIRRARGRARSVMEPENVRAGNKVIKLRRRRRVVSLSGNIEGTPKKTLTSWANAKKWGLRRQTKAGRSFSWNNEFGVTFAQWGSPGWERNYGRGFAKAGWIACLRELGIGTGGSVGAMAQQCCEVIKNLDNPYPTIEVANQVPYIEQLDRGGPRRPPANILARAVEATIAKMDRKLEELAAGMEAKFSGGQATEVTA